MPHDLPPTPSRAAARRRRIKRLTVCAMLCGLGVVLLYFGAMLEVAELCVVALCSMLTVPVVLEYRGSYPWALFFATATLALILLPTKSAALTYLACGSYPILKAYLERLPRPLARLAKEGVFVLMILSVVVIWNFVIGMEQAPLWYHLALAALGLLALHLFDLALSRLITRYLRRGRDRLRRWMN